VMRAFGFTAGDVRVRLSDRRLLNAVLGALGVRDDQIGLAYQALDKVGRREYAGRQQALHDAGVAPEVVGQLESLREIRSLAELEARFPSTSEAAAPLAEMLRALDAMGLGEFVDLDLTIVRGLAYYTGTVFELFDAGRTLRAICGGGRYDNLLQAVGGVDLPALGFGMGDVVLGELLRERGLLPAEASSIDVFLGGIGDDDLPHVLAIAHELRDAGLRVEYALGAQPIGKQLKLADARHARLAVVVGPDDRARGEVMIKDLGAKAQHAVARDRVVAEVGRLGSGAGGTPRP
jgi:histidyl-tRNA synthetase